MTEAPLPQFALVKQADGRYGLEPTPGLSGNVAEPSAGYGGSPISQIAQRLQQLGSRPCAAQEEAGNLIGFRRDPSAEGRSSTPSRLGLGSAGQGTPAPGGKQGGAANILSATKRIARSSIVTNAAVAAVAATEEKRRAKEASAAETAAVEAAIAMAEPEEQLRKKLLALGSSFATLDKQVEEDLRRRRDLEERRCQELVVNLGKLEQQLHSEANERELAFIATRQAVENRLSAMVAHLQGRLSERFRQLSRSVEALCERCSTVERGIAQFKGELPSKLQIDTAALKHAIRDLSSEFSLDKQHIAEQDAEYLRRIEEGEFSVDTEMQKELARLERRGEALQELIDQFAAAQDEAHTRSQKAAVWEGFAQLREMLAEEVSRREHADDKVVQAINEYTSTLHRSLSAANA
eukprot:gb/GFBE01023730.1/.p1 GENE.gb/GFBE01023730.1/~~gb/GFBE01023730.1/.p1  ORF type:complete len:408 (+),score=107.21 gb/GFBE01023730.1/:1-1224(+)